VNTDLFFNQPTYNVFCPDIDNPTVEDFEQRLKDSKHGPQRACVSRARARLPGRLYLVTDEDGVITGQVMEIGLGGPARSIG